MEAIKRKRDKPFKNLKKYTKNLILKLLFILDFFKSNIKLN